MGCAIGALFLSKVGDMYGRRVGIMTAMIIYIVGIIVQIASQHAWYQIMIGRIITGLAVGMLSVLCPLFISEVSPKHLRGTLVYCFQLMITLVFSWVTVPVTVLRNILTPDNGEFHWVYALLGPCVCLVVW